MPLTVASYNILSSDLAVQEKYPFYEDETLDDTHRFQKTCEKFKGLIAKEAVICMQEVSIGWIGRLSHFFGEHNYSFNYMNYSRKVTGYMGVAVAMPVQHGVRNLKMVRVADLKDWPRPQETPMQRFLKMIPSNYLPEFLQPDDHKSWWYARNKDNFLMVFTVSVDGVDIAVANYHMPCAFRDDDVMVCNASLCIEYIKGYVQENNLKDFVFAGDFNARNDGDIYAFLTTGEYKPEIFDVWPATDTWEPTSAPIVSSYADVNGAEPEFTNFTKSIWDGKVNEFTGCLDYIFYGKTAIVAVESAVEYTGTGPFPTVDEPSDHVLLWTRFEVANNADPVEPSEPSAESDTDNAMVHVGKDTYEYPKPLRVHFDTDEHVDSDEPEEITMFELDAEASDSE